MRQTLLSTKFNPPAASQTFVVRSRLLDALAAAKQRRLTLVSAPPGYGKTSMVSSWLRITAMPYTWLSLDESDNDPVRFLEYFLTALNAVVPAIRPDLLDLRQGPQAASYETLMALLINEAAETGDFFVVLDDFQALHSALILDMLNFLIEHLPSGMHMLLLSRSDPPMALHRLRARGQLLEIRAEQLRFNEDEIATFFTECLRLDLSHADVTAIEARTEGWIAGLQLAGLAMQVEKDPQRFIEAFSGSHAYIVDYLTEEVLRGQAESIRSFLLQTSILERMCAPLCEALITTGAAESFDGQAALEEVERNHLFVIPLDNERRWYRYHHLFKEVLSRRLEGLFPGQIPSLHRRAAEWFEQNGLIHEAVQHAIKTGDADLTVHLVEAHGCDLLMGGELVTLARWLAAVEAHTQTRPWLAMQKAWVLSLSGPAERAELAIDAGERLLSTHDMSDEVRTLLGSFTAARAQLANRQGKPDLAAQFARNAIAYLDNSGDFSCSLRSVATSLLGDASWVQGKMDEARRAYADAVQIGQMAGNEHMIMLSSTGLADVYFEQGQIHQAFRLYSETLQMAERVDGPNSAYAHAVHFGLGRVFTAWNRQDEAAASIEKCREGSRHWGNANLQAAALALNARVERAGGSIEKAWEEIKAAEDFIREHPLTPYWSMWVKAALAQGCLDLGKVEQARLLLHQTGVLAAESMLELEMNAQVANSMEAPIPYRLEPAATVLARLFLALGNPDAVLNICERLVPEANAGGRGKALIELLILQALAFHAKKDTAQALTALERAITLARPEQSTRMFLDEGERMAKLLYLAKAHRVGGDFVDELLFVMDQQVGAESSPAHPSVHGPASEAQRGGTYLVEPLSEREMEVLRCIAEGCSNQEIADRFVLSPKTVKRHISNIYAKLEAKNRTQAVALARALKLIE